MVGLAQYFIHRTGHGLGLEIHEPPYIVAGSLEPLAPGTTFTIEPGVYVEGVCGVRIEDDVVITSRGRREPDLVRTQPDYCEGVSTVTG